MSGTWRWIGVVAVLAGIALLVTALRHRRQELPQSVYVWQLRDHAALPAAIRQAQPDVTGWRVLALEWRNTALRRSDGRARQAVATTEASITDVVRVDDRSPILDPLLDEVVGLGTRPDVRTIEIDYDCPTARLRDYDAFLLTLRTRLRPDVRLSITALPTWLSAPDQVAMLTSRVDETVLQVHSVLDPRRGLFDPDAARIWVRRYAALTRRPFRVALPAYGSRIVRNATGRIVAVTSEVDTFTAQEDGREAEADPAAVAAFIDVIERDPPSGLAGWAWFRLPVAGDQRSWSMKTWLRVLRREPLRSDLSWRFVSGGDAGRFDLRIDNDGDRMARLPPRLTLPVACIAADGVNGYAVDAAMGAPRALVTDGSAPSLWPEERRIIGWARCPGLDAGSAGGALR